MESRQRAPPASIFGMAVFRPVPAERNFPVLEVADGGGEPDPARIHPGELRKPFNEAEGLAAAVAAHQGVNLGDDDESQVAEQPGDIGVFVKQQRLERFGRDLKNAGGILQKPLFAGLRDVAMPVPHRDIRLPAEVVEPLELIVDQRLQGADINRGISSVNSVRMGKKAASVFPDAVEAESSRLSSVLNTASPAAT